MTDNILELRGVSRSFPGFQLRNVSFALPKGFIMGLVGANGAGKTTTIRLILNMLERESGEILVFGRDNVKDETAVKQDVGAVFDSAFYVDSWTVRDTEKAVSIFYDGWNHGTFEAMVSRFALPMHKKVSELSRGMQMKLMLACAFSHDAKLLLLDEPTSGLDPVTRDEFLELLQEYIGDGERSVLFSTHITTDLSRVADYITLLRNGELVFTGSMEALLDGYRLVKGRKEDLTPELRGKLMGLRKTDMGFEGLLRAGEARRYGSYVVDDASLDDIVVGISRGEGAR